MKFHLRRLDREVTDQKALKQLLGYQQYFVMGMADAGEPYVVPMGYVYDEENNTVYFYCAKEGKKVEFLKKNPRVWGVVVLDKGVQGGACVNFYASAMFSGKVEWVNTPAEKRKIMDLFAERLSKDVAGVKDRLEKLFGAGDAATASVLFGRIKIDELTGKRSTEMTVEKLRELTS